VNRRVADLYAGSGALGFEALSRGALSATFVDNTHQSLQTIRANAEALGFAARAQIVKAPVERFVQRPGLAGAFDLVFLDPPYELPSQSIDTVLQRFAGGTAGTGAGLLAPGGIVLVERSTTTAAPNWPPGWEDIGVKRYGQTVVYWARAGAPAAGQEHDG
jgi:16S rRNA (guanine966-N2)-methyltransferase